jgi:hypothetical protein
MYIMNGTKFQKFIFFRNNWLFFGSLLVFSIFFFFNLMPGSSSPIAKIINFYIFMTLIFILLFFHIFKFKFIKLFIRKYQIFLKNDLKLDLKYINRLINFKMFMFFPTIFTY